MYFIICRGNVIRIFAALVSLYMLFCDPGWRNSKRRKAKVSNSTKISTFSFRETRALYSQKVFAITRQWSVFTDGLVDCEVFSTQKDYCREISQNVILCAIRRRDSNMILKFEELTLLLFWKSIYFEGSVLEIVFANPAGTQRHSNVHVTSITSIKRYLNVETTLGAGWEADDTLANTMH